MNTLNVISIDMHRDAVIVMSGELASVVADAVHSAVETVGKDFFVQALLVRDEEAQKIAA